MNKLVLLKNNEIIKEFIATECDSEKFMFNTDLDSSSKFSFRVLYYYHYPNIEIYEFYNQLGNTENYDQIKYFTEILEESEESTEKIEYLLFDSKERKLKISNLGYYEEFTDLNNTNRITYRIQIALTKEE